MAAIRRDSDLFYATADDSDPSLPVASCPGWTIADLVWHLGEVHWFWGSVIEMRASDPASVEAAKPPRPAVYAELVAWGRGQVDRMISLLEQNEDATKVWTWSPTQQTVGFIRRHQVQEAAVHRWDLQQAAAQAPPDPIDAVAAADSLDELLEVTLPWTVDEKKPLAGSVHIHCTDTDGEWFVHPEGRVEPIHAKGDAAIRGTASDLLLVLFKRLGIEHAELVGDQALARLFVERFDTA